MRDREVRATGIMVTTGFEGAPPPHGTVVDQLTYAPLHRHFVVARLDLDVDGPGNTVVEIHYEVEPTGPDNPYGLALRQVATPLASELAAQHDLHWESQRAWKVVNPGSITSRGWRIGP